MFGIGSTELFIIAVFAFLIFGPDKIPEIARTVSKAVRMFKDAQEDMQKVISGELNYGGDDVSGERKAYYAGASTAKQQAAVDTAAESDAKPSSPTAPSTSASDIWSDDDDEEGDEE